MSGIEKFIKRPESFVYRRAYIKRRSATTGLYESDWLEITQDIKSWGKITKSVDSETYSRFRFQTSSIKVTNDEGKYNDNDTDNSLWFGYMSPQRTLLKIETGFLRKYKTPDGYWANIESPNSYWDASEWDVNYWDEPSINFISLIQGDIFQSSNNEVVLPVKPLLQVFRDFPAAYLTGYTSTGMTAQQFVQMVRDQQDASANYIFRPFFGDTTTNWEISTTTVNYTNLNTSTSESINTLDTWEVIEKLAQAENFVAYIANDGVFKFVSRSPNTTTSQYDYYGFGTDNTEYGHTIKKIESYGKRVSKFYSRVQVKFNEADTITSYQVYESTLAVSAGNLAWEYGARSLDIENLWIPNTATADTIAQTIFADVGAIKRELKFKTTFIPHLEVYDRVTVTYDTAPQDANSLWDINDWAPTTGGDSSHLTWDKVIGESIKLINEEFKLLSITVDLDKLETTFEARET